MIRRVLYVYWLSSLFCIAGCVPEKKPIDQAAKVKISPNPHSTLVDSSNPAPSVAPSKPSLEETTAFELLPSDRGGYSIYRNGEESNHCAMIETIGGGIGIFDFDCDGNLDLFFPTGGTITANREIIGTPSRLYRRVDEQYVDCSSTAIQENNPIYSHGVTIFDLDNDGFQEVLVTGFGGVLLYRNQGDGTFLKTEDKVLSELSGWFTSAAAGDFNGDGTVDLYVCNYVNWSWENHPHCFSSDRKHRELCSPLDFDGLADVVLYSNQQGSWLNVSSHVGLRNDGKGLGVIVADLDDDGDSDIYVANDTTENFLYIDQNGKFQEEGMLRGVAVDERALPNGSMGIALCDINEDLSADIWVTNFELEAFALYRNDKEAGFLHTSRRYGIAALGGMFVGFGTDVQDFDLDGHDEIVVSNGHVLRYPVATPRRQTPLLLRKKDNRYVRVLPKNKDYFTKSFEGRGLATGDLDRDGLLDIVVSHLNEPAAILKNTAEPVGRPFRCRIIGRQSNRDAVGTRVLLTTSRGKRLKHLSGGGSYLSHCAREMVFALLPEEIPIQIDVVWANTKLQVVPLQESDQERTIIEP